MTMSNQTQGPKPPDEKLSNLKEGQADYGGEKEGLNSNQPTGQTPPFQEGRLQARGNEATPSSTSGMSHVRTHQSSGIGNGKIGGTPEGGHENQYSDQAEKPV